MKRQTMLTGSNLDRETPLFTILTRKNPESASMIHHISHLRIGVLAALAGAGGTLLVVLRQELTVFVLVRLGLGRVGDKVLDMCLDRLERFRMTPNGALTFRCDTSALS